MKRGRSRLAPNTHGGTKLTVHYLSDDAPLCGRKAQRGLDDTDDDVSCSWCLRMYAKGVRESTPAQSHQPKRVCRDCGEDWPCQTARPRVGQMRDWYLSEIGTLMADLGSGSTP